jgi:hypothetical protein
MKVGDLVELNKSVLERISPPDTEWRPYGVITSKHGEACKVHWFNRKDNYPSTSQYLLKLKVISEL